MFCNKRTNFGNGVSNFTLTQVCNLFFNSFALSHKIF